MRIDSCAPAEGGSLRAQKKHGRSLFQSSSFLAKSGADAEASRRASSNR